MYCWLKPDTSANCSWVRPFSSLILRTLDPTIRRMSMATGLPDVVGYVYHL